MDIRKAIKEDRAKILPLIVESNLFHKKEIEKESINDEKAFKKGIEETFDKWIGGDDKVYFIAEEDGIILGFLLLILDRVTSDSASLRDLYVIPEKRKSGIATELLKESGKYLESVGIDEVVLAVHKNNKAAFELYKKFGFTPKEDEYIYMEKLR